MPNGTMAETYWVTRVSTLCECTPPPRQQSRSPPSTPGNSVYSVRNVRNHLTPKARGKGSQKKTPQTEKRAPGSVTSPRTAPRCRAGLDQNPSGAAGDTGRAGLREGCCLRRLGPLPDAGVTGQNAGRGLAGQPAASGLGAAQKCGCRSSKVSVSPPSRPQRPEKAGKGRSDGGHQRGCPCRAELHSD